MLTIATSRGSAPLTRRKRLKAACAPSALLLGLAVLALLAPSTSRLPPLANTMALTSGSSGSLSSSMGTIGSSGRVAPCNGSSFLLLWSVRFIVRPRLVTARPGVKALVLRSPMAFSLLMAFGSLLGRLFSRRLHPPIFVLVFGAFLPVSCHCLEPGIPHPLPVVSLPCFAPRSLRSQNREATAPRRGSVDTGFSAAS